MASAEVLSIGFPKTLQRLKKINNHAVLHNAHKALYYIINFMREYVYTLVLYIYIERKLWSQNVDP